MAFTEDHSVFFDQDEFAVQAEIVLPAECAGRTLTVIFDNAYEFVEMGSGVSSSGPAATLPESDMPEPMADALEAGTPVVLSIDECEYTVVEAKPDGSGVTTMRLRK